MTAKKVKQEVVEQKIASGAELSKDEKQAVMEGEIIESHAADSKVEPEVKPEPEAELEEKDNANKEDGGEKPAESGEEVADEASKEGDDAGESQKKKEPEPKPEEKPSTDEEWKAKAEKELAKEAGMEDLSGFTPREKGLFYELRRQRRRAQRAEVEKKEMEHKLVQKRAEEEKEADVDIETESKKIFDGKEDDDLLTVKEARKLVELTKKGRKQPKDMTGQIAYLRYQIGKLELSKKYPDADTVLSLTDELFDNDSIEAIQAKEEVKEAYNSGGNFVEVMYNQIKSHPKFSELDKKNTAKPAEATGPKNPDLEDQKKRATKLAEEKTRTTGGAGGGATGAEITLEEASKMSPKEYAKLPEKTRKRLLGG